MDTTKTLSHYGTPRHSGRYPWGSGDDSEQHNRSFNGHVNYLRKQGMSDVNIAKGLGMTTTDMRKKISLSKMETRKNDTAYALALKEKGMSNVEIGKKMGINESSVRSLLNPSLNSKNQVTQNIANVLKENVEKKHYIDVGPGVENYMGISRTKLKTSIALLKEEGYTEHKILIDQMAGSSDNKTTITVLAAPGTKISDVYKNKDKISLVSGYSNDKGISFNPIKPPKSIASNRVQIRYNEEGGIHKDGVIEIRRGVDDLSLGNSRYAQVRIAVDNTHYLKGMAMYSDKIPDGVDVIFNTNKKIGTEKFDVMKKMKDDPDNPFGATVRQRTYIDKNGKEQQSVMNIVREEGSWGEWSKTISSQMLSKQSISVAKNQLDLAHAIKKEEFEEIMSLTNPIIKKRLLEAFSDDCDSSAVHLDAAALPRQGYHVILPFPNMKETEIYAPNYKNGENVALIRFPHGGTFEIPELKVNNKFKEANDLIRNAPDAVGINHKVAERLSGADFDGDATLVIPNNNKNIKSSAALKGLAEFDPKTSYPPVPGMKVMGTKGGGLTGQKMGDISNLITDMTIKGASTDEICRAVRHSMVVIDAEKHGLNYTKSYVDNGIAELKQKYQGGANRGASTLISRSSSEARPLARKEGKKVFDKKANKEVTQYVDPKTGKKLYTYTGETYVDKNGKIQPATVKSSKMYETDNAFNLSSGTPMETVYANYANKMKSLGNEARKAMLNTKSIKYSPSAKKVYEKEVTRLNAALNIALKNAPLERQAQLLSNTMVRAAQMENPDLRGKDLQKIKGQKLAIARTRTGAHKQRIDITDKEWEAIQAGAISSSKLSSIINNTDLDKVKQLATPRSASKLSTAKLNKAKAMLTSGYTQAEVAESLGVSTSALLNLI